MKTPALAPRSPTVGLLPVCWAVAVVTSAAQARAAAPPGSSAVAAPPPAGESVAQRSEVAVGVSLRPRTAVVDPDPDPDPELDTDPDADPAYRKLQIQELRIVGREQVSLRQVFRILRFEKLTEGTEIFWPEDPRIERAQERLRATGYFKQVVIRLEPVAGTRDQVLLIIDLTERGTVSVQNLYLGSSAFTPFRGGVAVAERNFMGRGIQVGGALVWGSLPPVERARRQQAYRLFFEVPRLGAAPIGILGAGYVVSASEPFRVAGPENDPNPDLFRTADYSRAGGVLGLTFPILPDLTLGVDYRFERVDARVPAQPMQGSEDSAGDLHLRPGVHRLTTAHFGLLWDERQEEILAGKGGRIALDLQLSSPALGSQYEYVKLVAAGAYSFRLPWRHWVTPKVSGGQIAGRAPRFELFYAGDLSDWTPGREQGVQYSTRNPIDVFGTGIDTRTYGVIFGKFDLEYVWPLFRRARTRAFYGGDLYFSTGIFTLVEERAVRKVRKDAGERVAPIGFNADIGIRLDTALGTFAISIGNILRRTPL